MTKVYDSKYLPVSIDYKVGQKVVIFNQENDILFLRRSEKVDRAGGWDFPGGALEDESPEAGIAREVEEEAGITISDIRPSVIITHHRNEKNRKTLMIGYVARLASNQDIKLSWEHDQFKWLTVAQALKVELPDDHMRILKTAIESEVDKG